MPTRADGAARSEFERAARSGTLRAPPTTTPPKPAEATLGFSSTRKTIDNSPGWRYSSDQKKRLFKFPIRMRGGLIKHNVTQDNLRCGIEVTNGSTAIRITSNQVLDNGDEGIHLSGPDDRDAGHQIVDNTVDGNALEGIHVLRSNGNLIAGNTVRYHGAAGIYVKESDRNTLDANTLINDPIQLVYGSSLNVLTDNTIVGQQIRFKEASDNQVYGLTVRAEGGRPSVAYEFMSASRNRIADSEAIEAASYDIRAAAGSMGNLFTRFSGPAKLDCSVDRTSSVSVTNDRGGAVLCGK